MSNELVEQFKKALATMSYYNAAEGSCYTDEMEGRLECQKSLRVLAANLKIHGIDPAGIASGWLVSSSDYSARIGED